MLVGRATDWNVESCCNGYLFGTTLMLHGVVIA
jgi:hypothetical protein